MTRGELRRHFESGGGIACENSDDRNAVIELMLEMGYEHGGSHVSEKCLQGSCLGDVWLAPFIDGDGIEFYPSGRRDDIPFNEIAHLICTENIVVQVDDLL